MDEISENVEVPEPNLDIGQGQRDYKKIIITLIIVALLVSTSMYWYFNIRAISIEELSERDFEPGDTVTITGTITDLEYINTTYGQLTLITLGEGELAMMYRVAEENITDHQIGDKYTTDLLFEELIFNDVPFITSKKLWGNYHTFTTGIQEVIKAVSIVSGIGLYPINQNVDGTEYSWKMEIHFHWICSMFLYGKEIAKHMKIIHGV